jgi:hypothetical protein
MDNDQRSLFENDDSGLSYAINLTQLNRAVCEHLRKPCWLRKDGEGSFHKVGNFIVMIPHRMLMLSQVYDVLYHSSPLAVVRVARPCMARDKMESEV